MEIKTQTQTIHDYLKSGRSITPIDALNLFGCFRLGARIYDIEKNYGLTVERKLEFNGKKRFMRYWL